MASAADYKSYVEPVRVELMRLARAGKLTYYKDLGKTFGKPARWALWRDILDDIALTKPDISIIVLRSSEGWQGQINGAATDGKPSSSQKKFAQDELAKVFKQYCPAKPIPQLPVKRS